MGGAALVLGEAWIDAQALLPDGLSARAVRFDGADSSVDAVDHDLGVGMGAQVVVPGGMVVLAEVEAMIATSPCAGIPRIGTVRGRPLFAPVVVSITTGIPETRLANV